MGAWACLHSMVDSLSRTGVDVIKFQTHLAEAESSAYEPFRVKFSYVDRTRFDYWKRMEFTPQQWRGIKSHCDESGVEFLCSPFSCAAVDLLEDLGVRRYKIASGEISNYLMIEKIARTGKPIILSTGLSTYAELDECVDFIRPFGNAGDHPAVHDTLSDPRRGCGPQCHRRAQGALSGSRGPVRPFRHHLSGNRGGGPWRRDDRDTRYVRQDDVWTRLELVPDDGRGRAIGHGVRFVEEAASTPVNKNDDEAFKESKRIFGKSLAVNKDLKAGSVLSSADLEAKKPLGCGVPASEYQSVIGKSLLRGKKRYDFLERGDLG